MRSEARVFAAVCSLLTRDGDGGSYTANAAAFTEQDWGPILALAKRHRVAPAIWRSLRDRGAITAVPAPIQQALGNIYQLNERRNKAIRDQATRVASLLNAAGIQPVLLKTIATMSERSPTDIGMWITRDIDLLVERNDFLRAPTILGAHGYAPKKAFDTLLHSYPALFRAGELVSVDLHRDLGPQRNLLSAEEALAQSELVAGLPCRVSALVPTHRVLHLLFHDEIQDRRFELGRISLHQLINFAYLV
ncbi:MAG: nucleotidyltransferase family protein, partial [Candidatus Methylomirabilis sp.]